MRIFLAGEGEEIPLEALPDPTTSDTLPPLRIELDPTGFDKRDYVGLGYTHYEVWCIGAAGGSGGLDYDTIWWHDYFTGVSGSQVRHFYLTDADALTRYWAVPPAVMTVPLSAGGGGGGGGLHRVSGLLADLPNISPVVIGQAGTSGPKGHLGTTAPTVWLPPYTRPPVSGVTEVYDNPHLTFYPPRVGGDGGASIFNGGTAKASGGKGGGVSAVGRLFNPHADGSTPPPNNALENSISHAQFSEISGFSGWQGYGGEGGLGNRTTAGGGGAGSTSTANGGDGTWDGDIGGGGGGGRGGVYHSQPSIMPGVTDTFVRQSTSGGQGSYSFGDTSVYGIRQPRSGYNLPGGGGGAKVGSLQYGSFAPGYSPNGVVIIRVSKIT